MSTCTPTLSHSTLLMLKLEITFSDTEVGKTLQHHICNRRIGQTYLDKTRSIEENKEEAGKTKTGLPSTSKTVSSTLCCVMDTQIDVNSEQF